MSVFLETVNKAYGCSSTDFEYLPKGQSNNDLKMTNYGILAKSGITHEQMAYAWAVIGSGDEFNRIVRRKVMKKHGMTDAKKIAGMAFLSVNFCKNQKLSKYPNEELGISRQAWDKKYKVIFNELKDWIHNLDNIACINVSKTLNEELS